MRLSIMLNTSLGMILAALQPLSAQNSRGNVEAGRRYAIDWCSGCHSVEPKTVGIFAADFAEVAKLPSTTALSLKVFLRTSHHVCRISYYCPMKPVTSRHILSLKRKRNFKDPSDCTFAVFLAELHFIGKPFLFLPEEMN